MYMLAGYIVWLLGTVATLSSVGWRNHRYHVGNTIAIPWRKSVPHRIAVASAIITVAAACFTVGSFWYTL